MDKIIADILEPLEDIPPVAGSYSYCKINRPDAIRAVAANLRQYLGQPGEELEPLRECDSIRKVEEFLRHIISSSDHWLDVDSGLEMTRGLILDLINKIAVLKEQTNEALDQSDARVAALRLESTQVIERAIAKRAEETAELEAWVKKYSRYKQSGAETSYIDPVGEMEAIIDKRKKVDDE